MAYQGERVEWDGCTPQCPACMKPTTGLRERRAGTSGGRYAAVIYRTYAVPCGCDVTDVADVMTRHHRMKELA